MHASSTPVMLSVLSLCAAALLLPPASAEPARRLGRDAAGDRWPAGSPAEAPMPVAAAPEGAEADAVAGLAEADGIAVPTGRQGFRPRLHASALSPDARRGLEHEARCGPRVTVPLAVPWPGWKPRCHGGATVAPAAPPLPRYDQPEPARRLPLYDEP
ncbi:hypothetical protein ACP70R_021028 [Stipagrostis hirtigluma subsp. patula]